MNILNVKKTLFIPLAFFASQALAVIDINNVPIVLQTAPTKPNVLFLLDDSGSMGNSGSFDILYSPGFNFQRDYTCDSSAKFVSNTSTISVNLYEEFNGLATINNSSGEFVLGQDPSSDYQVSLADNKYTYECKSDSTQSAYKIKYNSGWSNWFGWDNTYSRNKYGFNCSTKVLTEEKFPSQASTVNASNSDCKMSLRKVAGLLNVDGGNCNWTAGDRDWNEGNSTGDIRYLVKSLYVDTTVSAGSNTYTKDFPKVCFYDDLKYNVKLRADNCSDRNVTMLKNSISTESVSQRVCDSNSQSAQLYSGKYLNWYFSNSSSSWFGQTASNQPSYSNVLDGSTPAKIREDVGGVTIDLDNPGTGFVTSSNNSVDDYRGYRNNTQDDYRRMDVAYDVAAFFISGVKDFEVGLGSYDSNGGQIDREILELGDLSYTAEGEETKLQDNRVLLLEQLFKIKPANGTPLAEAYASLILYYLQGINNSGNGYKLLGNQNGYQLFAKERVEVNLNNSWQVTDLRNDTSIDSPVNSKQFCQKNYIIGLTDGVPSSSDTNITGSIAEHNYENVGSNGYSKLDDLADFVFKNDMRPDINDADGNTYFNNIISFFIGFSDDVTNVNDSVYKMLNSAGTRGGGGFYAAADGYKLAQAFEDIANTVPSKALSVTQVAVSSVAELATENYAYQAGFDSARWNGDVNAFFLNIDGEFQDHTLDYTNTLPKVVPATHPVTNKVGTVSRDTGDLTGPVWQASDALNRMYVIQGDVPNNKELPFYRSIDERDIYTINRTNTGGVHFNRANINELPTNILKDLSVGSTRLNAPVGDFIDYLRGDQSKEIDNPAQMAKSATYNDTVAKFRTRLTAATDVVRISGTDTQVITDVVEGSLLGDITNSSPEYVAQPPRPWTDADYGGGPGSTSSYALFKEANKNRVGMLYVGANDGMLHAFTTEPQLGGINNDFYYDFGSEVFAYIPSFISSTEPNNGLHYLAEPGYQHRYLVNATPTVSDVFIDLYNNGSKEWRTVLVAGVGNGGAGIFALDITCPFEDNTSVTLDGVAGTSTCSDESFDETNVLWEFTHPRLGKTFSQPVIGKVNYDNSSTTNGNGNGRWAAIFNNGYNSATESAALFIVFLDGPTGGGNSWTEGVDYLVLEASETDIATADTAKNNGLSSPQAVDLTGNGRIDRVYAGDLTGRLWVWNITAASSVAAYNAGTTWTVDLLFTAQNNQAITTAPQVAPPLINVPGTNLMVMFGSGRLLTLDDISASSPASKTQTIYGIHDRDVHDRDLTHLQERTLTQHTFGGEFKRKVSGPDHDASQFGWYMNLPTDSERVIYDGFVLSRLFVITTFIPDTRECRGGSTGWTLLFDWYTGLATTSPVFDANNDGKIDDADLDWVGYPNSIASSQVSRAGDNLLGSSGNNVNSTPALPPENTILRRISWDEKFPFGILK